MENLFHPQSLPMRIGRKLAMLMYLHFLTVLACLPVFTAGAAFSAMHKLLLQIYRDEEYAVTRDFFSAFRENFRQATGLFFIFLALLAGFLFDYWLIIRLQNQLLGLLLYALPVGLILWTAALSWVFVLQSRYRNTLLGTLKLALGLSIRHPLRTLAMTVLMTMPLWLCLLAVQLIPLVALMGFTLPGILRAMLYSQTFDLLEDTDWRKEKKAQEASA